MADPLRTKSVSPVVQRLVDEVADSDKAGRVFRISFDPGQSAMAWPRHWPQDAILTPGAYCTDRYMVVDFLGRGGIAEVYEARDMLEETLVALKVVRTGKERADVLEKVAAEALTLKEIKHRNVLRVFDAGFVEAEGLLFFSMERLVGATLHDAIYRSRGPRATPREPALPLLRAVHAAIGVARGVNALHERGTFHRDIKPENLFLTREGDVKVFDLDVAKFSGMVKLRTTRPGYTMGTVLYMSPELLREGITNERSDIYAIGMVLFEMVAGHHAFASHPDEVLPQNDVIAWHSARLPPRLSKLMPGVPVAVDAIVRKCVAKEPAARFQSCEELLTSLLPLSRLLQEAEAQKPAAPVPDAVVRVEGTTPSPKLPLATTDQTTTGVPSTPYAILPPPLDDEVEPVAGEAGQGGAASRPPSTKRSGEAGGVSGERGLERQHGAAAPREREQGTTSGVHPMDAGGVETKDVPLPGASGAARAGRSVASAGGRLAEAARGPSGTDVMPMSAGAPVFTAQGTQRMIPVQAAAASRSQSPAPSPDVETTGQAAERREEGPAARQGTAAPLSRKRERATEERGGAKQDPKRLVFFFAGVLFAAVLAGALGVVMGRARGGSEATGTASSGATTATATTSATASTTATATAMAATTTDGPGTTGTATAMAGATATATASGPAAAGSTSGSGRWKPPATHVPSGSPAVIDPWARPKKRAPATKPEQRGLYLDP